ncbi:MAG TPA: DUF4286 family protein [Flavipsychrobacter sp.]|nr:DUF4286 family protein [Flavipsychrobacter sp.]
MIIYNVTVKLEKDIEQEWVHWMREDHMPALFDTGCFDSYQLCKLLDQDEADGVTYVAQYHCKTRNEYETYISKYAQQMRDAGLQRFGNKFIAFRTLMDKLF